MHFNTKSYLISNHNHIAKQALDIYFNTVQFGFLWCFLNYFYFKNIQIIFYYIFI
jgi:hypothetical protein